MGVSVKEEEKIRRKTWDRKRECVYECVCVYVTEIRLGGFIFCGLPNSQLLVFYHRLPYTTKP